MFTLAVILCAIAVILVVILLIVMFIVSGITMIYFDIKMKSKPGYKSRQRFNKKMQKQQRWNNNW